MLRQAGAVAVLTRAAVGEEAALLEVPSFLRPRLLTLLSFLFLSFFVSLSAF